MHVRATELGAKVRNVNLVWSSGQFGTNKIERFTEPSAVAPDASVNLNDAAVFRHNIDFDNRGLCWLLPWCNRGIQGDVDASIRRYRARFCKRDLIISKQTHFRVSVALLRAY